MKLEISLKRINELMSRFEAQIKNEASVGRTDLNKAAETILIPLLNEIYGWDLENINYSEDNPNYPGIDLADKAAKVCVQVTATRTLNKVKHTLNEFVKHEQYLIYNRLIVLVLREKQQTYSDKLIQPIVQDKIDFDVERDIWDYRDLFKEIANFQIEEVTKVQDILEANFGEDGQWFKQRTSHFGARVHNLPKLPYPQLSRIKDLNELKKIVFACLDESLNLKEYAYKVGMYGMGGIGKSVLATILAHEEDIQAAFPDGVFWITLGQEPSLTLRQSNFAEMLGDGYRTLQDIQQGKIHLSQLLEGKTCLLVLDDVWKIEHVTAFDVLSEQSRLLFTTRDKGVVTSLNATEYPVNLLDDNEALELLAAYSGQNQTDLPPEAHQIIKECGNLPLALSMIGAIAKARPNRWQNLLYKLQNADLGKIRHQFPDYPYPDLLKAIQVSVDALDPDIRKRYLDFAVFPEDAAVPEAALRIFWETEGLDQCDTEDFVDILVERSLARRDEIGNLSLHDLQHDYVKRQNLDLPALHHKLLNAYSSYCPNGWHTGPNDGYFFEYLPYHLWQARRKDELFALAKDVKFESVQRNIFANEPRIILETARTALKAAIETNSYPEIAYFSLKHAYKLVAVVEQETPLDAIYSGNTDRAVKLIEIHAASVSVYTTWALLITWALKEQKQEEEAQRMLKQLQEELQTIKPVNLLSSKNVAIWQGDLIAYALAQIFEIDIAVCINLSKALLGVPGSRYWMVFEDVLCNRRFFTEIFELRKQQNHLSSLTKIAELQAQRVSSNAAKDTYCKIIDLIRHQPKGSSIVRLIAISAKKQIEMGHLGLAENIFALLHNAVDKIQDINDRIKALLEIADCQIDIGEIEQSFLKTASDVLDQIDISKIPSPPIKVDYLRKQAKLSVKFGNCIQAKKYIDQSLAIIDGIFDQVLKQIALRELVDTQASLGFIEDALKTVESIERGTYQVDALSYILDSQIKEKNFDAALKTVEQDYFHKYHSLQRIVQAQAEIGQFEDAMKTVARIPEGLDRDAAWASIIEVQGIALSKAERKQQTITKIFQAIEEKIKSHRAQVRTFTKIAEIQLQQEDFSFALQTINKIKDVEHQSSADADKLLVKAHAKIGDFRKAFEIAEKIKNPRVYIDALATIAKSQQHAGQTHDSIQTYAKMLASTAKHDLFHLKSVALLNTANIQIESGRQQDAVITLEAALENIKLVDEVLIKLSLLAYLAEKWMYAGDETKSKHIFKHVTQLANASLGQDRNTFNSSQVFATIAECKARAGDTNTALEEMEKTLFPSLKAGICYVIANSYKEETKQQSRSELKNILKRIYTEFQSSSFFWSDPINVLCKVVVAQFIVGDNEKAKANLTELYDFYIKDEDDKKVREKRLVALVSAFAQIADIDTARIRLEEIEMPELRVRAIWGIIYAQWQQNQHQSFDMQRISEVAIQTYETLLNESQQAELVNIIAKTKALSGNCEEAIRSIESFPGQNVELLPQLANIFMSTGKTEYFNQLIIPCSYYLESAYKTCEILADLHPEHSLEISEMVKNSF